MGKVLASWRAEDCRTCSKAWVPGLFGEFDLAGLFTVHPDHSLFRTRFTPEMVLWVSGELVGTPSDPS